MSSSSNRPEERPACLGDVPQPDDGVDVTLIRWLLGLSVRERLEVLQAQTECIMKLRDAAAKG